MKSPKEIWLYPYADKNWELAYREPEGDYATAHAVGPYLHPYEVQALRADLKSAETIASKSQDIAFAALKRIEELEAAQSPQDDKLNL